MADEREVISLDKAVEYAVTGSDRHGNSYPVMHGFIEGFDNLKGVANTYHALHPTICHMCIDLALPMTKFNLTQALAKGNTSGKS